MNRLKRWFIPSVRNHYHPHALRPIGLGLAALILIAIPPLYNIVEAGKFQVLGYATNISVGGLHVAANAKRSSAGLPALSLNSQLSSAASAKASHMLANNYWAHTAPDGTSPWSFISGAGYSYTAAGENLAKGFYSDDGVINAWMASATHKANVLGSGYKDVGYAVVNGILQGQETTLIVAMYAAPYTAPSAPAATTKSPSVATTPRPTEPTPAPAEEPAAPAQTTIENDTSETKVPEEPLTQPVERIPADIAVPTTTVGAAESTETNVLGVALSAPAHVYNGLNWGQKASIGILAALVLLFVLKHTAIWRAKRRGLRHIWLRSHPIGQSIILASIFVITLMSNVGVIL